TAAARARVRPCATPRRAATWSRPPASPPPTVWPHGRTSRSTARLPKASERHRCPEVVTEAPFNDPPLGALWPIASVGLGHRRGSSPLRVRIDWPRRPRWRGFFWFALAPGVDWRERLSLSRQHGTVIAGAVTPVPKPGNYVAFYSRRGAETADPGGARLDAGRKAGAIAVSRWPGSVPARVKDRACSNAPSTPKPASSRARPRRRCWSAPATSAWSARGRRGCRRRSRRRGWDAR